MTPNWFAYFALLAWPVVGLYFYFTRPVGKATLLTVLGGYLLLPVGASFKVEMIPELDKSLILSLTAALGCAMVKRQIPRFLRGFGWAEVVILLFIISPFITSELNTDPIRAGITVLPGETFYDALSAAVAQAITLIPFILGRQFLSSASEARSTLRILVIAGLWYSLLMFVEIRMSPQLHRWIYGFFPNSFSFITEVRENGYRPSVFVGHGLELAVFTMTTVVAAAALWRTRVRVGRLSPPGTVAYLSLVLILCKSLAALLYGAVLAPLVFWGSPRLQLRVATVLVTLAMAYPMLRSLDLVPTSAMLSAAGIVSDYRVSSLKTRFDSEDILLQHASERPWFGWGRWGRGRAYGSDGQDLAVTDGGWIITLSTFGIFGLLAEFGLFSLAIYKASGALKFVSSIDDKIWMGTFALIVAAGVVDLIPNGFVSPWNFLVAGALLGRAELFHLAHKKSPEPLKPP